MLTLQEYIFNLYLLKILLKSCLIIYFKTMKNLLKLTLISLFLGLLFGSCNKPTENIQKVESFIEFSFSLSPLKSGYVQGLTNVVVTIEDLQGNVIKNMEKVEIYSMNEYYLSKPISILTGDYKLTSFIVLDADNNVVYASPVEGSEKAYLVENPLPLEFKVQKDNVTKLVPEVLSTAESLPEDFGYSTFGFEISQTFDFLVGAFIYNEAILNFELTTATITVYSNDDLVYSGELQATGGVYPDNYNPLGITNKIALPERFESFTVEISKDGYQKYCKSFTKEELRLYYRSEDNGPLVVILEPIVDISGLIAYYPFNGNANDASGYDNNGVVYGATLAADRKGNDNCAYSFNGIDNYISVTNTPDHSPTTEITVSGWILVDDFSARHYILDKRINLTSEPWTSYALYSTNPGETQTWLASLTTNSTQISVWSPYNNNANQWYHLLLKYDGSTLYLYVDGALVQSTSQTGSITYSNMDLYIGTAALNQHFTKGKIDDIRIYNRALTEEEIQLLYNE